MNKKVTLIFLKIGKWVTWFKQWDGCELPYNDIDHTCNFLKIFELSEKWDNHKVSLNCRNRTFNSLILDSLFRITSRCL